MCLLSPYILLQPWTEYALQENEDDYMSKCESILAGVDFSSQSAAALREAIWLAQRTRLRVCPVHVVDTLFPTPPDEMVGELSRAIRAEEIQSACAEWNRFVLRVPEARHLRLAVEVDSVAAAFAHRVRFESAVLIVIGLAPKPGERLMADALATACLQDSAAPALLVHEGRPSPFSRIAVCSDFSDASRMAFRHALRLAAIHRASLQVLHISNSSKPHAEGGCSARLHEFCAREAVGMPESAAIREIVDHPVPDEGLSEHLTRFAIDLAVLGIRERWAFKHLFMESRLEHLVQTLPTSILVVGPEHQTLLPEAVWSSEERTIYGLTA